MITLSTMSPHCSIIHGKIPFTSHLPVHS